MLLREHVLQMADVCDLRAQVGLMLAVVGDASSRLLGLLRYHPSGVVPGSRTSVDENPSLSSRWARISACVDLPEPSPPSNEINSPNLYSCSQRARSAYSIRIIGNKCEGHPHTPGKWASPLCTPRGIWY